MNRLTIFTAIAVFSAVLIAGAAPAEAGRVCKPSLKSRTSTPLPSRTLARASAVTKWSAAVASAYSLSWSNWDNATAKKYSCWRKTTIIGTNSWRCTARAKPCVYQ